MSKILLLQTNAENAGASLVETTLLGWLGAAVLNTLILEVPSVPGAVSLPLVSRLLFHIYDVGQTLALGAVITAATWALSKWTKRPRYAGWTIAFIGSAIAGILFLRDDLSGVAGSLVNGRGAILTLFAVCAATACAVPVAAFASSGFARPRWRALPIILASLLAIANYFVLSGDYPGAHLLVGSIATSVACAALRGVPLPLGRWQRAAISVFAGPALVSSFIPAPSAIAADLSHSWTAGLVRALPRTALAMRLQHERVRDEAVFHPGSNGAPTPATSPPLLGPDPIVIYFSVDSLRADLIDDAKRFPHFRALRDEGTTFNQARSPGTQTAVTLTSVMTGTYYSQQYWTPCAVPEGKGVRALFAHEDPHAHFPALLAAAGIPTVQYGQAVWLENKYGMTSGFTEGGFIPPTPGKPSTKGKWSTGNDVMKAINTRLRSHRGGPLFLFFHDLDPHAPFTLGKKKKGAAKSLYLAEIALADARLGRLRKTLRETGLSERTVIILTADHGEAFGEHGTSFHGQNLYDEQVRVPLVMLIPGQPPRQIDDPVTLMDLGPTILDLMGLATPAHFMGQSLVPYLKGDHPKLTRPIIAEGRLKQSMLLPNGFKLIRDQREGTFEIYDLAKDPKEKSNLYDDLGDEGPRLMQKLIAFFAVHQIQREGYEVPFRR